MNATAFSELLTDIADEYIVSAANPQRRSIRWYQISAVAACIVLVISAAVYPKLRGSQPDISDPPAYSAETTALTTESGTETISTDTQTTLLPNETTKHSSATSRKSETESTGTNTAAQTEPTADKHTTAGTDTSATTPSKSDSASVTTQSNSSASTSALTSVHTEASKTTASTSQNTSVSGSQNTSVSASQDTSGSTAASTYNPTVSQPTGGTTNVMTSASIYNPTGTQTTSGTSTTTTTVLTEPPEPRTLLVPVYKKPWDPLEGDRTDPPPEEPQYGFNVFPAQFMQEVYHWSPQGIRIFDYDYLRVGVSANAAAAAILHAEYSGGKWVITVGLQSPGCGKFLEQQFLVPVPKDMHVYGNQCSVEFQYADSAVQQAEIEMDIH